MAASYAPCIEQGGERYGIATLTRLPIVAVAPGRTAARGQRASPEAPVRAPDTPGVGRQRRTIDVVNTHLSVLRRERRQMAAIGSAG